MKHTKYQSYGPCGFREEDFLFIFSIKTYMLPWQPEFQSDLPNNTMQPFLLSSHDVFVI